MAQNIDHKQMYVRTLKFINRPYSDILENSNILVMEKFTSQNICHKRIYIVYRLTGMTAINITMLSS